MTEKTYSQMRKDFYKAYRTKIVPAVQKFEKERKSRLFIACIIPALLLFACFIFAYTHFFVTQDNNDALKFYEVIVELICTTFFISWIVFRWIKKTFENKIKQRIMPFVTSCYEKLKWLDGEYYANSFFTASNLIKSYDKIEHDDVFYGLHNNVGFDIVETMTKK